jgi:catechol-2,3-dioxygenase
MSVHIGHVALRTRDLQAATGFFREVLGLSVARDDATQVLLTASEKHHELELLASDHAALDHVGLEVESDAELQAVVRTAVEAGGTMLDDAISTPGLGTCLRLCGPGGITYELYTRMERTPSVGDAFLRPGIRRLGHLTFLAEDADDIVDFWVRGLGFRISDQTRGITWARCDSDHHGLAVGPRASGTVLHHHAWEVQDIAALGRYCDSLALASRRLLWGPVRHGPGYNLATYLPDLDGGVVEVYSDLQRIIDEAAYVPVDWEQEPNALNLWGPPTPDELFALGLPVVSDDIVQALA